MDIPYLGYLDDTPVSQTVTSPIKTSTTAKENIKWNEDAFFKRQGASESLFLPPAESPITALNDPFKKKESLKNLRFPLNDSTFVSEGANSSLGILNLENIDFSDNSLRESNKFIKKEKLKKKLRKIRNVYFEDKDFEFKDADTEGNLLRDSRESLASQKDKKLDEVDDGSGSSSSDFEYDGTNIPELNMDWDVRSQVDSDRADVSRSSSLNSAEYEVGKTLTISKESDNYENSFNSQFTKDKFFKSDAASRESSENARQSIFQDFQVSFDSLQQQLLFGKESVAKSDAKIPKTIKVCPFLNMNSFEIEPILHNPYQSSTISDVENARCSENLSVDFCPEQISARSSSFNSSMKFESPSSSEKSNVSDKGKILHSLHHEDLENEVLSGSTFQMPESKVEYQKNCKNIEDKDSGLSVKSTSDMFPENFTKSINESEDLKLLCNNLSGFVPEGENWCSRLGISESDFFSSETVKEILKKDKEAFEKEQMFESVSTNNVSTASNWSPPNQHEITAPSWFTELSPNQMPISGRHISIGTLISARSENLGTLSEDSERERPYFGTLVSTPPKIRPSDSHDTANSSAPKTSVAANYQDSTMKRLRISVLSELLEDISTTDPLELASKFVEKCNPILEIKPEEHIRGHDVLSGKNEFLHATELQKESIAENVHSDIEDSESTLVQPTSANSTSRQIDINIDGECKSTAAESEQCMENSLNFSVGSSSERESIKTTKSDTCTNCSLPSSQHNDPQEFSRPTSSCSSACNPSALDNALNLQYGCMKYLNSCSGHNQHGIHNINLLQGGNSALPCSHVCSQHALQPNLLSIGGPLQSVIQNTLSGPLLLSGRSTSYLRIQAPSELHFPEKIALGDSQEMNLTIQNSVGCYYQISCISAYLNDSPLPFEMSGLSYNKTVPSNMGNTTDIKLVLAPKYEGTIGINLQIDAFLNSVGQTLNVTPDATVRTKIQYDVVRPSISIVSKGKDILNIGSVIANSTFVEYITVINNCEVSVPLRISLSNESLENQIYFGLKEMDRQKHPMAGGLRFLSPRVLLFRLPASKNKSLLSSLDIPIVFESIKGRVNSTLTAAIETPTLSEVLAFIKISAVVGNAKLVLKDPNQNPLILKAFKGATCNHSVTVINDGTLPVVYDIHIDGDNDVLSVSPSSLNLQAKQSATISVTFTPSAYNTVKGNLLAAAEPHGQVFTVTEIVGHVKPNHQSVNLNNYAQLHSSRPTRDSTDFVSESSCLIECNRKYLSWGGADIGQMPIKTLTIRNPKHENIQVKLFIKDKSQGFLFMDDCQKTSAYKLTLSAKEERQVSVSFIPKSVVSYSGLLCIKPVSEQDSRVFSIPLSGYGGTSKIKVLGLPYGEGTGYHLNVDASNETDIVHKNILLHNTGLRPAFVKLLITYDGLVQNFVEKQTVIHPSEFVLLQNEKKNVLISISCMNKFHMSNNEVVSILYGDEVLRQGLRKKFKSSSSSKDSAYNINFHAPFDGEDKVAFDPSYISSPKDESLFYNNLNKLMIHIFLNGQNTSFSRMSFGALSEIQESFANLILNSNTSTRRLTIEGHSPPVKESPIRSISRLSLPVPFEEDHLFNPATRDSSLSLPTDLLKDIKWIVQPEELIIDGDNKNNRILLKNFSNLDLRFKVECIIDIITVSPLHGILPANGDIGLRINFCYTNRNKLTEDYHGNIKILCDGIKKNILVKVPKDNRARHSNIIPPALNDSLRSGFLGDSYYMDTTLVQSVSSSLNIDNVFNFPKEIDLQKTKQGVLSETALMVCNPTKDEVTWNIYPMTMLFIQPFDDSIDCSTSTIEFLTSSGILKPAAVENIMIKFLPQTVALYSQFFEFILSVKNDVKLRCNIKVQGEALADIPTAANSSCFEIKDKKQTATIKKKVKAEIFTENEVCKFPMTASGQKSSLSITIKNISNKDNKLTIMKPKLPFIVNFSTLILKSQKFLTIPVHFNPQKPSIYKSEVKFICENGYELKIKLKGSCPA